MLTPAFWILDSDGTPIPFLGSPVAWAEWLAENWKIVRVGNTHLLHARHDLRVSTLFLGTAPRWPLFETVIFAEGVPELNLKSIRTATRTEAHRKHLATVEVVREWGRAHP